DGDSKRNHMLPKSRISRSGRDNIFHIRPQIHFPILHRHVCKGVGCTIHIRCNRNISVLPPTGSFDARPGGIVSVTSTTETIVPSPVCRHNCEILTTRQLVTFRLWPV